MRAAAATRLPCFRWRGTAAAQMTSPCRSSSFSTRRATSCWRRWRSTGRWRCCWVTKPETEVWHYTLISLPNCSNFSLLFHSRLLIKVTTSVYSSLSTDWASLCARLYKIKTRCRDSGIVWSPRDHDSFQSHPAAVVIMVDGGGLHPYQYCILILFLICHIPLFLVVDCNSAFPLLCFLVFLLFLYITLPPSDEQQPYSKVNLSPAAWLRVVSILFLLSLVSTFVILSHAFISVLPPCSHAFYPQDSVCVW